MTPHSSRLLGAIPAALILTLSSQAQAQAPVPPTTPPPQESVLVVDGHTGEAPIYHFNGRRYLEIEDFARLTQASLSFRGPQVLLTLPAPAAPAAASAAPARPQGFSRGFLQSGIEAMSVIREWRIAIVNAIQNDYPLSEDWVANQRRTAETGLALVSAAVTTDDDRSAYPLLATEYNNLLQMSDRFVATRKAATYIDPTSLTNDPLDARILACSRALAAMAAANHFQDDDACH